MSLSRYPKILSGPGKDKPTSFLWNRSRQLKFIVSVPCLNIVKKIILSLTAGKNKLESLFVASTVGLGYLRVKCTSGALYTGLPFGLASRFARKS